MADTIHTAVLLNEAIAALRPKNGGRYLDATLGGATHTRALLDASAPDGVVVSFDVDPLALKRARTELAGYGKRWIGVEANFRHLASVAQEYGFAPFDGILIDLGVSSDELSDPAHGLSFQVDGPLDMRLGPKSNDDGLTAAEIVNTWVASDIEKVLRNFGDEKFARRIVDAIIETRKRERIVTTFQLRDVILSAVPPTYEHGRIHPATRSFQALRIVVNDELVALEEAVNAAATVLAPGGRIAVISFHSLEDAMVKRLFRSTQGLTAVTPKPVVPSDVEIAENPRSRSAKLRVAEKIQSHQLKNQNKTHSYDADVRALYGPTP